MVTALSAERPSLDAVFAALMDVVRERRERGLSSRSAGVKSVLAGRLGGQFDERMYGFSSFRRFLEEAQRRGLVAIVPAVNGPDVDVVLGADSAPESARTTPAGGSRIRADLWRAFVHWESDNKRYWDTRRRVVVEKPLGAPVEDGLVLIGAATADIVKSWMRDFAEGTPTAARAVLLASLDDQNPFRTFRRVTDDVKQTREWRRFMQNAVERSIEAWVVSNGLDLDIHEPGTDRRVPQEGAPSPPIDEEAIRRRVLEYVMRMTLPELLAVPVPVRLLQH